VPRYYFDIRMPGELIADRNGQDLPDLEAAKRQAFRVAQQILASPRQQAWTKAVFHIRSDGQEVATVPFAEVTKPIP
jgi:hypothetical protein